MHEGTPITSLTGTTRKGAPLALSRPPAEDLRPWFPWISVAEGKLPADRGVRCRMLGDQACFRLLYGGVWTAETADGQQVFDPGQGGVALYFGPQSRAMPIGVTGSAYKSIALHLAAGAPAVLGGPKQSAMLDRIAVNEEMVGHGKLTTRIPIERSHDEWLCALETELRRFLDTARVGRPDPLTTDFEICCLAEPNFPIKSFAETHGVSVRTVERAVKRDFGMTPKQVMRRARALDVAATLLGVGMPEEEPEVRLRYFDQSHLTREMRHFFGMTPREMALGSHPFLRLTLESRQTRRLRALDRLASDEDKPWLERREGPRRG